MCTTAGAAPALQDLVAGHVHVMFDIVPLTKEQLAGGRCVRWRSPRPSASPRCRTCRPLPSLACPGSRADPWFGLFAPAGTPRAAIDWVNAEASKAFSSPDLKARLGGQGLTLPLGTPEAFGKHVEAETGAGARSFARATSRRNDAPAAIARGERLGEGEDCS